MDDVKWMPIETAPKDEDQEILVYDGYRCQVAWIGWHDEGRPVYFNGDCSVSANYWMPLPEPPTDKSE